MMQMLIILYNETSTHTGCTAFTAYGPHTAAREGQGTGAA